MATKRDYKFISTIAVISAIMALPILANLRPAFWSFSFGNILALLLGSLVAFNSGLFVADLIARRRPGFFQFSKYLATGVMNSLVDVGILNLQSALFGIYSGSLIILFNFISFAVAVTHAYFWSNGWVFKREGGSLAASEYMKFFAVTAGSVIINTAIVYLITTAIGAPATISGPAWENIAKLFAVPVSVLWNFFGYKIFVFK